MRKKATKKKKLAANKLLEEKERAIQEGIRQKMVELEEKHAQSLLDEALKVDVKKEIQRRFDVMLELDQEQKEVRKRNEVMRQRRLEDSIEDSSYGYKPSKVTEKDSIDTSQQPDVEDSAASVESKFKGRNLNKILVPAKSKDESIRDDTIQESLDDYSNDFNSVSHSASNLEVKPLKKAEEKPKVEEIKEEDKDEESEIPSEIDEDYSHDFDESNNSSHFSQSIKSVQKKKEVAGKDKKVKEEIKEENEEDEEETDHVKSVVPERRDNFQPDEPDSKSGSVLDDTPLDSERDIESGDEIIHRIPTGKSDEFIPRISESASSTDLEVLETSNKSVEWVLEVPIQKPDIKKTPPKANDKKDEIEEIPDDIDEDYEDDFESADDFSDKESTPRVGVDDDKEDKELDIMEDHEKLADIIAEELFKSIDSAGLFDKTKKIVPPRDFTEEDFKDKFPFVKPKQERVEKYMELESQIDFFNALTNEILKPHN